MVAPVESDPCDHNGGKQNLRLAVVHPNWEHISEAITKPEAPRAYFGSCGSPQGGRFDSATIGGEAKRI
jgi:hypothetical protein